MLLKIIYKLTLMFCELIELLIFKLKNSRIFLCSLIILFTQGIIIKWFYVRFFQHFFFWNIYSSIRHYPLNIHSAYFNILKFVFKLLSRRRFFLQVFLKLLYYECIVFYEFIRIITIEFLISAVTLLYL